MFMKLDYILKIQGKSVAYIFIKHSIITKAITFW